MAKRIGETNAKTEKIWKKAEGWGLLVDKTYTLSLTSAKDYDKEAIETMTTKMNENLDGKIQSPIFLFAGYLYETEE